MAASQFAYAKTGGQAGPKAAPARSSMDHSERQQARQSVARRVGLTTFRQNCGNSTVNGDPWGGSLSQGRRIVSQFRIPLPAAGLEVLP
jgi:hypothetical protein